MMKSERSAQSSKYFDPVGEAETTGSTEEEEQHLDQPTVQVEDEQDVEMQINKKPNRPTNLYMAKKAHAKERLSKQPPALHKLPKPDWKLEYVLMSVTGVLLMLGGAVWSITHYATAPRYEPVTTGLPIKAANCFNKTSLTEVEQTKCFKYLKTSDRECRLAVTYNFTIPGDGEEGIDAANVFTYTGTDLRKYPRNEDDLCIDDEATAAYLALENITVWYDPEDPTDSITYEEPTSPENMAALIAGLFCGFGFCFAFPLMFHCCDFCCVLNDNRRLKRHWKEWEKQQQSNQPE